MSKGRAEFIQQASLSQQLANTTNEYTKLAGADTKTSLRIARFMAYAKLGLIDPEEFEIKFLLTTWNYDRMAFFATSDRVNEVTKMGLQMPRGTNEVDFNDDTR